jgi:Ran GTPase-activating protein (RanGAP) involved in mRNA processing and transport
MCDALHANRTLTHLNLGSNGIGPEGAEAAAAMLRVNPCGIRHLNLGGNWIRDAGAEAISEALMNPHVVLRHLELGANDIELRGAAALARALRANSTLLHLDLRGNAIEDEGAAILCAALSRADGNTSLQQLILAENGIGNGVNGDAVWVPAVCAMLRSHAALLHVDLALNGLSATGVVAVCETLCDAAPMSPLQRLGLGSNDGGDEGAVAAADLLRAHTGLLYLGVSNSDIGEVGLAAWPRRLATTRACKSWI